MRLVQRTDRERRFALPPGLYEVSAVLEDGREHRQFASVKAGAKANVEIGAEETAPATAKLALTSSSAEAFVEAPRYTRKTRARGGVPPAAPGAVPESAPAPPAAGGGAWQLLEVRGASVVGESPGEWIFEGGNHADSVPTAAIQVGEWRTVISLPVSPQGVPTANTCAVRIDETASGARASAWISPERTVANALQNMLAAGELTSAAHMADEATLLLRDKYSDPAGAALGALILNKVGRLERLQSWVENLARDFAWMPDGSILLAMLLVETRAEMGRAQELMMAASEQRPLYTESYSILLDLLRRWPGGSKSAAHQAALEALAVHSPYVDWDSLCFSTREP
jgi:hypothetical protein